jgi:dihydrofolate synthase/folylpolyglutamate synthase
MKFGLRGIRRLLASMGHPERNLRTVHIAGTNGKGSTAAMIASIFTAAGYRVGLTTSPHVLDFTERIRIDGRPIPRREVMKMLGEMRGDVDHNRNTFFEAATAMAFRYFADQKVDLAVVETGLGGRLDATNVLVPLVSVITTISLDHTQLLGKSLRSIAREKGGIIKRRVPCVLGSLPPSARSEIVGIARSRRAPVFDASAVDVRVKSHSLSGTLFDLAGDRWNLRGVRLSLPGLFQLKNVRIAVVAADLAAAKLGISLSETALRNGFRAIRRLSGITARLQLVRRRPPVLCDVAHNPEAARALATALRAQGWSKLTTVFGVMADKDARGILRALKGIASNMIVVSPRTPRARPAADLARMCRALNLRAMVGGGVAEGLSAALQKSSGVRPVLVTGSFFVVGEALAALRGKKYLTINQ